MAKRYKKHDAKYENNIFPRSADKRTSNPKPTVGNSNVKKEMLEGWPISLENVHFIKEDNRTVKVRASSVGSYSGTDSSECYSPTPVKYTTVTFHNLKLKADFDNSNSSKITSTPEDTEQLSVVKKTDETSLMTNVAFFRRVEPLSNNLSEASVRLQSFLGSCTENGLDSSTLLKNLKSRFTPYIGNISDVLDSIPRVLSSTYEPVRSIIEIGNGSNKYNICQPSFEKAVSKYSIKDAAVALVECDTFLCKKEKLESTIGRKSSSFRPGNKLKPLDPAKLAALCLVIADKSKMSNIQRTQDCLISSPDYLTVKEQKMVREALSQYFNQLRQRQKRKRSNPHNICSSSSSKDESSAE